MINKNEIVLKPLLDEDIPLFDRWLSKDYIYKWLCPDGEGQRDAWLDEVNNRNGKYDFIRHFIVYYKDKRIGYCLFADCFFLKDLEEEGHDFESLYGDILEKNIEWRSLQESEPVSETVQSSDSNQRRIG